MIFSLPIKYNVPSAYKPINYIKADSKLDGHLKGIDDAFASIKNGNFSVTLPTYSAHGFAVGTPVLPYETVTSTATGSAASSVTATINPAAAFGSSTVLDPSSVQGVKGQVYATTNQTSTSTYYIGVMGRYLVSGTNASTYPKVGILGVVGDTTTTADAAIMAFIDGDGGLTTARAGFGIAMTNSTAGSGFDYGIDLKIQDPVVAGGGSAGSVKPYHIAEVRLADDAAGAPVVIKVGAFVDNATSGVGIGSIGIDSVAGLIYVSDAAGKWALVTIA
jgi:hypothetical protein